MGYDRDSEPSANRRVTSADIFRYCRRGDVYGSQYPSMPFMDSDSIPGLPGEVEEGTTPQLAYVDRYRNQEQSVDDDKGELSKDIRIDEGLNRTMIDKPVTTATWDRVRDDYGGELDDIFGPIDIGEEWEN